MSSGSIAILFALGAAISWGFSSVFVRLAQQYMPTTLGTLISLVTGIVFAGLLVVALDGGSIAKLTLKDGLVFAVIGVFNFPLGRFMNYMSIRHLGIGRSTPMLASVPVFSSLFAVVFFGEKLGTANVIGTALVLGGIYLTLTANAPASQPSKTPERVEAAEAEA